MGISLAKITDFFGLANDDEMYQERSTAPKQPIRQPRQEERRSERKLVPRSASYKETQHTRQPKEEHRTATVSAPVHRRKTEKVVSMPQNNTRPIPRVVEQKPAHKRISVVEPRVYTDAMTIAKRVGEGEIVLVNFQSLDEARARRIVDFLTGAVFMIDGDIKRVGNEMFLCTPTNVEIDNSTLKSMTDEDIFGLGM